MKILEGQRALVVGVANERSIAWAIAQKLHAQGAEVAFTFMDERLEKRVRPLAAELGSTIIEPLDVNNDAQATQLFEVLKKKWGKLDILVHSIAFADKSDLEKRFIETTREGFVKALDVSAYSLVELCRRAEPLMTDGGTVITLSYLGAERVITNYNVMGVAKAALEAAVRYLSVDLGEKKIRINAISAGPVKTLAAAGIRNFRSLLDSAGATTPLRENISAEDVGELAAFLCGPGGKHITGSTMYVDSGAHIMGPIGLTEKSK